MPDLSGLGEGRLSFRATGDPTDPTRLTLTTIRRELARICADRTKHDPHSAYLDGRELFGEDDAVEVPLPDELHPDPPTHRLIAERCARTGGSGRRGAGPSPCARRTR